MARTFGPKHYRAIAEVIYEASLGLDKTVELDVITGVMLAFVERFKADSSRFSRFDGEKFKEACRGR